MELDIYEERVGAVDGNCRTGANRKRKTCKRDRH